MTEQSPSDRLNRASNEIFEATSFLNGTNAAFVEQMYAAWLADPNSVDSGWQAYFAQLGEQNLSPTQLGRGPAWNRDARPAIAGSDLIAALTGQIADALNTFAGSAKKQARHGYRQARANVDSAVSDLSERGGTAMEAAQDAANSMEETLEEVISQRPLATVGLALGLGFLIGLTWRR